MTYRARDDSEMDQNTSLPSVNLTVAVLSSPSVPSLLHRRHTQTQYQLPLVRHSHVRCLYSHAEVILPLGGFCLNRSVALRRQQLYDILGELCVATTRLQQLGLLETEALSIQVCQIMCIRLVDGRSDGQLLRAHRVRANLYLTSSTSTCSSTTTTAWDCKSAMAVGGGVFRASPISLPIYRHNNISESGQKQQ